jgi:4-amino-4-deoxy-L-arabinose transferase-like glycosyltransferase
LKRAAPGFLLLLCAAALYFLYFFGLARTGMLGPDEPRYAAIGRAMAESGDWITPRLWSDAWFEKPPLLYWTTALAFKAGLNEDLGPRLPVALIGVAFLVFFFIVLRRDFGERAAWFSVVVLGTSAGWLAYSHVAVPDLPMSAMFGACMLLLIRIKTNQKVNAVAGILLGLSVLAKGLVPLALFAPALWWMRHRIRDLIIVLASAFVIAAPWYLLVTARNGSSFLDEFFWKHHFARVISPALMHVRPFWFYVPVLLAALFPWTPLLILLSRRSNRFLLGWFAWGFILFSISLNKLPGYLLPLLPPLAALIGIALAEAVEFEKKVRLALASCAALLWLLPVVQEILPVALLNGLSHTTVHYPPLLIIPLLLFAAVCGISRRELAIGLIAVGIAIGVVQLVRITYPILDRTVSPRQFWQSQAKQVTCVPSSQRSWRYGLSYYAGRNLPDCN